MSSKSDSCTENLCVYAAGISVKVRARITRGDLTACHELLSSRGDGKSWQKSAEGIVSSSTELKAEHEVTDGDLNFDDRSRRRKKS
jgi:hypothetical protein